MGYVGYENEALLRGKTQVLWKWNLYKIGTCSAELPKSSLVQIILIYLVSLSFFFLGQANECVSHRYSPTLRHSASCRLCSRLRSQRLCLLLCGRLRV